MHLRTSLIICWLIQYVGGVETRIADCQKRGTQSPAYQFFDPSKEEFVEDYFLKTIRSRSSGCGNWRALGFSQVLWSRKLYAEDTMQALCRQESFRPLHPMFTSGVQKS